MLVSHTPTRVAVARRAHRSRRDAVHARELGRATILLTVTGAVDAATAPHLIGDIDDLLRGYRQLVLDLSGVDFFGAAGYSLLHRLHAGCAGAAVGWVMVTGPEVRRLLRICDADGVFPTAPNIVSAVATLARGAL